MKKSTDGKVIVLSKSRIKRGLQCPKSLHLTLFKPDLEPEVSVATQRNFDEGNEVGERARQEFPEGILIGNEPWDREGAIKATTDAIGTGHNVIFEAAFMADGMFARVDILKRDSAQADWQVYEVKKSKSLKDEHIEDVAIQALLLKKAGAKISKFHVMHLNPETIFPDLSKLFVAVDVTSEVYQMIPQLESQITSLQTIVQTPTEPSIEIGPQCDSPYGCPFKNHCWSASGFPNPSVFDLPGVGPVAGWKLIKSGKKRIEELEPSNFKGKTRMAIEVVKSGKRFIEPKGFQEGIKAWKYPLYFLDFETLAPAIPRFDGCGPYTDVPFQFSCHSLASPEAQPTHTEYLHLEKSDPRPQLIERLIESLGTTGSILAYSMKTERGIITALAERFPTYKKELLAIVDRIVDPLPLFQNHVYDANFMGSFGLKDVAPALVGKEYSYDDLEVADGMEARAIAEELIYSPPEPVRYEQLKNALLIYCRQDTRALVALVRWMRELIAA